MKRPYVAILALVVLGLFVVAWTRGGRRTRSTPEPTEAELRPFARLLPIAFRPAIAAQERKWPKLKARPVPVAVGLQSGERVRIVPPAALRGGHYDPDRANVSRDVYTAPRTPTGHLVETAFYFYTDKIRDVHFVVAGERRPGDQGAGRLVDGRLHDELLSDGPSALRDLGPIPSHGTRRVLRSPGSAAEGVELEPQDGAVPRLVALAPTELPSSTPAEPEGYAILFDTTTVWRQRVSLHQTESMSRAELIPGLSWGPLGAEVRVTGREHLYRVTALAHVYVRDGSRWRYARTWALNGTGSAWFTNDEHEFARAQRVAGGGAIALGRPDTLLANRIEELLP